ncbi:MAG: chromate transporter [Oscillospiraceae bacterium]|nr:chromate transporter [Oscillospiraceae bacterium]
MILLRLFWEFFKIGMFSVGGGMAALPFLYDMADRTSWFTYDQIADMLAVSESTPGPIGINMATYTGFTTAGVWGSVVATLGVITPGIVIVLLIVAVLEKFRNNRYVEAAFYGLRPASTGLIAAAGIMVVEIALLNMDAGELWDLFDFKAIALATVLLVLTRWIKPTKKLHPIVFIAASAVVGVLIF